MRPLEFMTEEERAFYACRDPQALAATDQFGRTLLHIAAHGGKAAICRIYLSAGVDPSKLDNAGRTAADLARLAGYSSLCRSLETAIAEHAAGLGLLSSHESGRLLDVHEQRALIAGDISILAGLISAGRLNARNVKGDGPLHLAASGGHLLLCHQLFEAGADATIRNDNSQTPAEMASEAGHHQLADLLRSLSGEFPVPPTVTAQHVAEEGADHADDLLLSLDAALGDFAFESEEDPSEFHARQDHTAATASFIAISPSSTLRAGDAADEGDWELPGSLAKVRAPKPPTADVYGDTGVDDIIPPDFSWSNRRSSRRPRKLRNTRFSIGEPACREWVQDALHAGQVDGQALRDLIAECHGNHVPDDLAASLEKILDYAGLHTEESMQPFLQLHSPSAVVADEDDLVEAIVSACSRNAIVPGSHHFDVDRASEDRMAREIVNARHDLLNAILDHSGLLGSIVRHGEMMLEGEVAVDAFTDLEIEPGEEGELEREFSENLAVLRQARETGVAVGGRARRNALEALEKLELTRSCLISLAEGVGLEVGNTIARILVACDRSTEAFVVAHLPFARRETAKMALPGEDTEELFQEAYFAIRRASERFDTGRGVRFYVYALFWIRQQIGRWRANNMSMIRVPVHRHELNAKISAYRQEFSENFNRCPTLEEISDHLECDVEAVMSVELALSKPLAFERVMSRFADDSESPEQVAIRRQSERLIVQEMEGLPDRESDVLRMRFGIGRDTSMTLEEIGQLYQVTRERIRQIEAKALKKLGHPGRQRFLRDML